LNRITSRWFRRTFRDETTRLAMTGIAVLLRSCVVSRALRFAEPIGLKDGAKLAWLRQTIAHLVKTVPPAERGSPAVLTAAEHLTNAAEDGGPIEFASIATLQAISRHFGRSFDPERKAAMGDAAAEVGHGMKLTHHVIARLLPTRSLFTNLTGLERIKAEACLLQRRFYGLAFDTCCRSV
jgi:hypothetical protein